MKQCLYVCNGCDVIDFDGTQSEGQQKKLVLGSKDPEVTATWRSELGRIRALLLASAGMQNTPSAEVRMVCHH